MWKHQNLTLKEGLDPYLEKNNIDFWVGYFDVKCQAITKQPHRTPSKLFSIMAMSMAQPNTTHISFRICKDKLIPICLIIACVYFKYTLKSLPFLTHRKSYDSSVCHPSNSSRMHRIFHLYTTLLLSQPILDVLPPWTRGRASSVGRICKNTFIIFIYRFSISCPILLRKLGCIPRLQCYSACITNTT